jgi:hypothetical protein
LERLLEEALAAAETGAAFALMPMVIASLPTGDKKP